MSFIWFLPFFFDLFNMTAPKKVIRVILTNAFADYANFAFASGLPGRKLYVLQIFYCVA